MTSRQLASLLLVALAPACFRPVLDEDSATDTEPSTSGVETADPTSAGPSGASQEASTTTGETGESSTGTDDSMTEPGDASSGSSDSGEDTSSTTTGAAPSYNYAFVSPVAHDADFGGIDQADAQCETWAEGAGLPGTYRAILSTTTQNANERLAGARGWIRPDGRPVADLPDDLFTGGGPLAPLRIDPYGADVGNVSVWSASSQSGVLQTGASAEDCGGWSDASTGVAWYGFADVTAEWLDRGTVTACGEALHVYCFGIDHDTALDIGDFAEDGRRMFVSTGSFDVTTGIEGADALCEADAEATAALAGGSFRAFIADSGSSAADRFVASGDVIVRVDGLRIAADLDALVAGELDHPPELMADGTRYDWRVIVGADGPAVDGTLQYTCNGWTTVGANYARQGFAYATSAAGSERSWFGGSTSLQGCMAGAAQPVYCLED